MKQIKTLQQYEKKYKYYEGKLVTLSKKDVIDFDKKHHCLGENRLLEHKKWVLIGNNYYEIPKAPRWRWFKGLNAGAKLGTIVLIGGVLAGGSYGIYYGVTHKAVITYDAHLDLEDSAVFEDLGEITEAQKNTIKQSMVVSVNDNVYTLSFNNEEVKEKVAFDKVITVKIGENTLSSSEYSYTVDSSTGALIVTIKPAAVQKYSGDTKITPKLKAKETKKEYEISLSETSKTLKVGETFNLTATIKEKNAEPSLFWGVSGSQIVTLTKVSNTVRTVEATAVGTCTITVGCTGGNTVKCNITVEEVTPTKAEPFETCDWSYISDACDALEAGGTEANFCAKFTINGSNPKSLDSFVGIEREVQLNHQKGDVYQTVRVIGYNHDSIVEKDVVTTKKAALTFEFKDLISDSVGNSLAYQWNDVAANPNYDYTNSTLRYALCGNGNNGGKTGEKAKEILAAEKGATSWSADYAVCVMDMLPSELSSVIKTVQKSVGTTSSFTETTYNDQLFILSVSELGYTTEYSTVVSFGTPYNYYEDASEHTESIRIKKQLNTTECEESTTIPVGVQQCGTEVLNYSGYYVASNQGSYYQTSSPDGNYNGSMWFTYDTGLVDYWGGLCSKPALGIAPGFCI